MPTRTRLALSLVTCAVLSLSFWQRPDFLISSDTLFPAAFVWDLLHHADAWSGFQQARVPSFFPDLTIFGAIQALTGSWRMAMALWIFVVLGWLTAMASWITARIARCDIGSATLAVLLIVVLVLTAAILDFPRFDGVTDKFGYFLPYLFTVLPYNHGGSFLLALTIAALASDATAEPTLRLSAGVFLLCCIAGVSDLICIITLIVPLTVALSAGWWVKSLSGRSVIRLLAVAWAGGGLGWAAVQPLDRQPLPFPTDTPLAGHVTHFLLDLRYHPGTIIVGTGCILALVHDAGRRGLHNWLSDFWPVFAAASVTGCLALTIVLYMDIGSYRYASPFLWWTVIFAAAALSRTSRRHPRMMRLAVATCVAGLALVCSASGLRVPRLLRWDTPLVACLQPTGLRAGLGDYWTARTTSAASDWQLQVEQIQPNGAAYLWGNDRWWFTHDIHDRSRRPPFRFIIMDRLPEDGIAAVYGRPDNVITCGGSMIWLYTDADGVYRHLLRASPRLTIFAATRGD